MRRVAEVARGSPRRASATGSERASSSKPAASMEIGNARGLHDAAVGQVDRVAVGLVADPLADQADEVLRPPPESWKPTRSAPSRPSRIWRRHGSWREQLGRRERDVQVEADPQVGAQLAQHRRDQLELVVLHPDDRALGGELRGRVGEPLVDRDVGVPPLAVELRLGDEVVVERPQGGVGEALVELRRSSCSDMRDRDQGEAVVLERLEVLAGVAGPADPGAVVGAHHRLERGDQAAGGAAASVTSPSSSTTRSTGSRLATTTRSAVLRFRELRLTLGPYPAVVNADLLEDVVHLPHQRDRLLGRHERRWSGRPARRQRWTSTISLP